MKSYGAGWNRWACGWRCGQVHATKVANHCHCSLLGQPPGSARVSRVGDGVAPSRTSADATMARSAHYSHRRLPHFEKPWAIYAVTIGTKSRRTLSPKARTVVLDALGHFNNERYELFAACVMPDHVHLFYQPWLKAERGREALPSGR